MLLLAACQRVDINNSDAVRQAVVTHIESRGDLTLAQLDITVQDVAFEGDTCEAQVLFVPSGQSAENGMAMRYTLDRVGDAWKVRPQAPSIHPMDSPDGNPHGAPESSQLPQGHPPIAPPADGSGQ